GIENAFAGLESRLELTQLVIHGDAQSLEGARRGMDFPCSSSEHAFGDLGQFACAGDWACSDDGAGQSPGAFLFAVAPQNIGECLFGKRVDQSGRRLALRVVHAHVERPVRAERETALALVELEGRYAEIERDTVRLRDTLRIEERIHLGK